MSNDLISSCWMCKGRGNPTLRRTTTEPGEWECRTRHRAKAGTTYSQLKLDLFLFLLTKTLIRRSLKCPHFPSFQSQYIYHYTPTSSLRGDSPTVPDPLTPSKQPQNIPSTHPHYVLPRNQTRGRRRLPPASTCHLDAHSPHGGHPRRRLRLGRAGTGRRPHLMSVAAPPAAPEQGAHGRHCIAVRRRLEFES